MTLSRDILLKAALTTIASALVSVSIYLTAMLLVDGPLISFGFWMSLFCPVIIAFPASAYQWGQIAKVREALRQVDAAHAELDRLHGQLKRAHAALELQARTDGLTGGLNREAFFQRLAGMLGRGRRGALLLFDADHFKAINDRFGHLGGDEALKALSATLPGVLARDDFWGRIGGEEFAVYLDGTDDAETAERAERLRQAVEAMTIDHDGAEIAMTISIGAVSFDRPTDLEHLFKAADACLYRAKDAGRNRAVAIRAGDPAAA